VPSMENRRTPLSGRVKKKSRRGKLEARGGVTMTRQAVSAKKVGGEQYSEGKGKEGD